MCENSSAPDLAEQQVTLKAPTRANCATYEIERIPSVVRLIRDVTPNGRVRVLMTNSFSTPKPFRLDSLGPLSPALAHRGSSSSGSSTAWRSKRFRDSLISPCSKTLLPRWCSLDNLCAALALADQLEQALTRPNRAMHWVRCAPCCWLLAWRTSNTRCALRRSPPSTASPHPA